MSAKLALLDKPLSPGHWFIFGAMTLSWELPIYLVLVRHLPTLSWPCMESKEQWEQYSTVGITDNRYNSD